MYKIMKQVFLLIFIFSNISFSEVFWRKNSFYVSVNETIIANKSKKNKIYNLEYNNDEIRMEVTSPSVNKGEIYTINKDKKIIYYPKLNQTVTQTLNNDDYSLLEILNDLKKLTTTKTQVINGTNYIFNNNQLVEIKKNNYIIKFSNYIKSGSYMYPRNISVTNGNIQINYNLSNFK